MVNLPGSAIVSVRHQRETRIGEASSDVDQRGGDHYLWHLLGKLCTLILQLACEQYCSHVLKTKLARLAYH